MAAYVLPDWISGTGYSTLRNSTQVVTEINFRATLYSIDISLPALSYIHPIFPCGFLYSSHEEPIFPCINPIFPYINPIFSYLHSTFSHSNPICFPTCSYGFPVVSLWFP